MLLLNALSKRILRQTTALMANARKRKATGATTQGSGNSNRLIWIDCEMTGLDPEQHELVEVACIVTEGDPDLTIVDQSENIIIHQSEEVLSRMSPWCQKEFSKNGLLAAIKKSSIGMAQAEEQLLELVQKHTVANQCPLAGNSVSVDRIFLQKCMPKFAAHLHYRTVDVSTIKELCKRWYPEEFARVPPKKSAHRALDDIIESMEELRHYRKKIFIPCSSK